ncbi:MAG: branched-chain amino acid aminotransferase [Burkholderiales bacterium]|nr:MAG: branched-chain amino acid aminotransferase [Burkholderiales bacterium]
MAQGTDIRTWFRGAWHEGSIPIMHSADHGAWMGTMVFDGARMFERRAPDLDAHCERVNRSAEALGMRPTVTVEAMVELILDGLQTYGPRAAVYIRPMYWSLEPGPGFITADPESTAFAICLEEVPMPPASASATLTTTRYHRPTLHVATVNAKASCLYPNNQRMMLEAIAKGFTNALVADAHGNVAETATSNIFMVRDGEVFTPIANGTFLAGITRARHIGLLRAAGRKVHETTLTFDDFRAADEVFMTGNLAKITPVTAFDDVRYELGPVIRQARELYWDWAHSLAAVPATAPRAEPAQTATPGRG